MLDHLLQAAGLMLGILIGYFVGAMPGLTSSIGMALLIPFTFGLDPIQAIVMLVAIYMASDYGGVIPAILINAPGQPSAAVSAFDGFAMSRKGEAGRALTLSILASGIGAFLSAGLLVASAQMMANAALAFGPSEYFGLAVVGLSLVGVPASSTTIKALIALLFGLAIVTIGVDPIRGSERYVFNFLLIDGIPFLPALIGLFALSEVFLMIETAHEPRPEIRRIRLGRQSLGLILPHRWNILRSTLIGYVIGVIPGAGASIASLVSYGVARKASRRPDDFEQGSEEGLVASESANNASISGAIAPLLALGVPGSASAAILIGGLTIQGLQPGPMLFANNPEVPYAIFVSMFLGIPVMVLIGLFSAPLWVAVTRIPRPAIAVAVSAICMLGAYAAANDTFEMIVTVIFGVLGYVIRKAGLHPAPIVLALVLGEMLEASLRRAMITENDSFLGVVSHPITAVLLAVSALVVLSPLFGRRLPAEE